MNKNKYCDFLYAYYFFLFLVSLDGSFPNCKLPDYPDSIHYPAAVTFMETVEQGWTVVACGGYDLVDSTKCWYLHLGGSWIRAPDTKQGHCMGDTRSLIVDQGWWVAGKGKKIKYVYTKRYY